MPELSRAQLLVYAAIAVAVLLVGARWLRSDDADAADPAGVTGVAAPTSDGGFELERGTDGLVIHVAGAVRNPGVYRLPAGSRVTDALERAGGATAAAVPDGVNLAATVADGQQIVIPHRAVGPAGVGSGAGAALPEADGPISLGTATVEQLDTIEGIGPVTAQSIVEFRDEQGGLSSVEDLDQISGIGPTTMEGLREGLQP